jgi:malate dehydrogenase (oxaloacetate-decarboxylating)
MVEKSTISVRLFQQTASFIDHSIAECNNSVVFPGIGLGAILARVKVMTPDLLVAATKAVASRAPILKDPYAGLLPDIEDVREVSVSIAKAVIRRAKEKGLAQQENIPEDDEALGDWIREQQWEAKYRKFQYVDPTEATLHARGKTGAARSS